MQSRHEILPAFSSSMWTIYHHFPVNKGYKTTGQALHPLGVRFACLPAGRLTLSRPKGRSIKPYSFSTPFGYVRKHLSKGLSVLLRVAPQPYRFSPLIGSFALLRFTKALNEFFGAHEIAPQPFVPSSHHRSTSCSLIHSVHKGTMSFGRCESGYTLTRS